MNKKAETKIGKSFEELTPEEMNNVQGSCWWMHWGSNCCYSTRCSYNCCSSRCCGW